MSGPAVFFVFAAVTVLALIADTILLCWPRVRPKRALLTTAPTFVGLVSAAVTSEIPLMSRAILGASAALIYVYLRYVFLLKWLEVRQREPDIPPTQKFSDDGQSKLARHLMAPMAISGLAALIGAVFYPSVRTSALVLGPVFWVGTVWIAWILIRRRQARK